MLNEVSSLRQELDYLAKEFSVLNDEGRAWSEMTMHSSKGLEFPVVTIPGLGYMPYGDQDAQEEAQLLYVAMTRAMDHLFLSCHRQTEFVSRIRQARARAAA